MNRVNSKTAEKVRKVRGGLIFHNSVRQTLLVSRFVRDGAMKCRNQEIPVKCGAPVISADAKGLEGTSNRQQTVSKCFRVYGSKECAKFGLKSELYSESPCDTPEKFFCLPFFNLQDVYDLDASPQSNEDAPEFLFVDFGKFFARNSTSALHNVIFQQSLK